MKKMKKPKRISVTTVGETHLHLATYFLRYIAAPFFGTLSHSVPSCALCPLFSMLCSVYCVLCTECSSQVFCGVSDAILTSPGSKFNLLASVIAHSSLLVVTAYVLSIDFFFLVLKFYNSNSGHLHTVCMCVCVGVTSAGSLT